MRFSISKLSHSHARAVLHDRSAPLWGSHPIPLRALPVNRGSDDRNMRGGGAPYAEPKLVDLSDLARSPTGICASGNAPPWHS
eukprot:1884755-Prymnesium_polylepis.1